MSLPVRSVIYSFVAFLLLALGLAIYSRSSAEKEQDAKAREREIYDRAVAFEMHGNIQSAYRLYSHLCQDGSYVHADLPRNQQPCIRGSALADEIAASYKVTWQALKRYRHLHGKYPDELRQIESEIPPQALRAFVGFRLHDFDLRK